MLSREGYVPTMFLPKYMHWLWFVDMSIWVFEELKQLISFLTKLALFSIRNLMESDVSYYNLYAFITFKPLDVSYWLCYNSFNYQFMKSHIIHISLRVVCLLSLISSRSFSCHLVKHHTSVGFLKPTGLCAYEH